jgi:hypothetical protein
MPFTPTTANQADTQALLARLLSTPVGETCTYADLSAAIGRDVRDARFLLLRAIRLANRQEGALFGVVTRVGYRRMPATDAHLFGQATRQRIRRAARHGSETIGNALDRANDMPADVRRKALAEVSALNMLAHVSGERITQALPAGDTVRPTAESLRGILEHIGGKAA